MSLLRPFMQIVNCEKRNKRKIHWQNVAGQLVSSKITELQQQVCRTSTRTTYSTVNWICVMVYSVYYDHAIDDKSLEVSFCLALRLHCFRARTHSSAFSTVYIKYIVVLLVVVVFASYSKHYNVYAIWALRDLFVALSVAINIWFIVIYCKLEHVLSTLNWAPPSTASIQFSAHTR